MKKNLTFVFLLWSSFSLCFAAGFFKDNRGENCFENRLKKTFCQGDIVKVRNGSTHFQIKELDKATNNEGVAGVRIFNNPGPLEYVQFKDLTFVKQRP
jgi:hypothetical protein